MAKRGEIFKSAALTYGQQLGRMAATHPQFSGTLTRIGAIWTGTLQPAPLAETYTARINYTLHSRPSIWIVNPELRSFRPGEAIPHTFSNGSVCLHRPEDWTPMMLIADTIIPWLTVWLYHYEQYLALGKWSGGGH